jgi:hypothetical protein
MDEEDNTEMHRDVDWVSLKIFKKINKNQQNPFLLQNKQIIYFSSSYVRMKT